MTKFITILNTEAGNLFSLSAALKAIGFDVVIANTPSEVKGSQLVIPGQGRFGTVMQTLESNNWLPFLDQWRKEQKQVVGICVGMQILFEDSAEDNNTKGLGWFKGRAEKLNFPKQPMVGWANISSSRLPEGAAYFVNSYAIRDASQCIARTHYGESFCAAVNDKTITGLQFHPEKSGQYGRQLLKTLLITNFKENS
ncbi:imidazole glycerol phosphate synthase subunit HisH [Pleionea sp. CnH1-48]|uniref:imidazole glycerol phosphate synthase subunit HisH n=1 Tax=Pleionea sp. CnH1-48 TaxID=2954494 RepID=UPI002096B535|nr:imidazole glycerol phosphate synthase subunit HisH [Pleionea sp. CnH1-48]MCO7223092.1 imidazole glycerol phosphate synthase subunit HisH [Pleionea sp. CnH1-48]